MPRKKKIKVQKYGLGNFLFVLFALLNAVSLFLGYISGSDATVPINYLNGVSGKITSVFGIMFTVFKVLPVCILFLVQLVPADVIKKFVVSLCVSLWLSFGEIACFTVMTQRFEMLPGLGFYLGFASALVILVLCPVLTKINKAPKKHKDMVWYRGFNKIIVVAGMPVCTALTVSIILFADLIFKLNFLSALGILCIWGSLFISCFIAVFSLFEKYKMGMLYYMVAFLGALGTVAVSWSDSVVSVLSGVIVAAGMGAFWFYMGGVARKYF